MILTEKVKAGDFQVKKDIQRYGESSHSAVMPAFIFLR